MFLYEIVVEEGTLSLRDNKGIVGSGRFCTSIIYSRHFIASFCDREVSGLTLPQARHHMDPGPHQDHEQ